MTMKYEEPQPMSRDDADDELKSNDASRISTALVSLTLHDEDPLWLEDLLLRHLDHEDAWVRGIAANCLGQVARLHRRLNLDKVIPALQKLLQDPATAGKASDSLDDIAMFVGRVRHNDE